MTRGFVLPLTAAERVKRMLYLVGEARLSELDRFVRKDPSELMRLGGYEGDADHCPEIFYLLKDHNGGKDPAAPDPADRWVKPDETDPATGAVVHHTFVNRTCDCIGGMSWAGGWDRYQQHRFAHLYDGWINTDSMILDARGAAKCFIETPTPELGGYVVIASGSPGYKVGHIRGVIGVPTLWEPNDPKCWEQLALAEVAAYSGRANRRTTGRTCIGAHPVFVRPIMTP